MQSVENGRETPRRLNRRSRSQRRGQAAHQQKSDREWVRSAKGGQAEEEPGASVGLCWNGGGCASVGPAGTGGAGLVGGGGGGNMIVGGGPVQFGSVIKVSMAALPTARRLKRWKVCSWIVYESATWRKGRAVCVEVVVESGLSLFAASIWARGCISLMI